MRNKKGKEDTQSSDILSDISLSVLGIFLIILMGLVTRNPRTDNLTSQEALEIKGEADVLKAENLSIQDKQASQDKSISKIRNELNNIRYENKVIPQKYQQLKESGTFTSKYTAHTKFRYYRNANCNGFYRILSAKDTFFFIQKAPNRIIFYRNTERGVFSQEYKGSFSGNVFSATVISQTRSRHLGPCELPPKFSLQRDKRRRLATLNRTRDKRIVKIHFYKDHAKFFYNGNTRKHIVFKKEV